MTNQEIYDKIVNHLREQNCKSEKKNAFSSTCLYRGPNGLKCAAGILISDEEYVLEMENVPFVDLIDLFSTLKRYKENASLIECLQRIHDYYFIKYWEEQFENIAACFGLNYHV